MCLSELGSSDGSSFFKQNSFCLIQSYTKATSRISRVIIPVNQYGALGSIESYGSHYFQYLYRPDENFSRPVNRIESCLFNLFKIILASRKDSLY